MISDKFIPSEGFNGLFTEIKNCDIISRPTNTGFQHPLFWFTTRPGLTTQLGAGGVFERQGDSEIKGGHYNNNKIYPYSLNGTLYDFDGDLFNIKNTGNYYDNTRLNDTLQVSFAGGGRYPNEYSVFTVSAYNGTTAQITTSETLTAQQQADLPGKYVYMKTGAAQRGFRKIESVVSATVIQLSASFGNTPVSGDIIWIYNKVISQSRFPQVRQGSASTYIFHIKATITTTPTTGATYTNGGFTFTVVSTALSSGVGKIKCTGTGNPGLSGTLTKTTGTGDATITFYDSDIGNQRFLALDNEGNVMYWYYPNAKKLIQWDNRIMQLHNDTINILPTDSNDLEIVLATKIVPSSSIILNIDSYSGYFVIFYKDRIGILRKTITNATTQDFVYTYQDVSSVGLYSEQSYIKRGGNLYFFGNDNILYSLDLASNGAEVIGKPTNQGQIMIEYFKNIIGGSVTFRYSRGVLRMIHIIDGTTTVYKFFESYKGWIIDDYAYGGNLFAFMNNINTFDFLPKGDKIFKMGGFDDDGTKFRQSIKMEGPLQEFTDTMDLQKVKLRYGFDGINRIAGKVIVEIGGTKIFRKEVDITKTERIDEINSYIEGGGMIGGSVIGDVLLGGTPGFGEIKDYYSPYQDIAINVGKKGQWCRLDVFNDSGYQMIFGGLKVNHFIYNSNAVSNKTVI